MNSAVYPPIGSPRSSRRILLFAIALAIVALYVYQRDAIPAGDFSLGQDNHHNSEEWKGTTFTASSIEQISAVVGRHAANESSVHRTYVAWFGNSQLHTINQYKTGDHLAPYWLRTLLESADSTVPLGISLPNANLQEHFVLSRYVQSRLTISGIILELVYDDLREDDLRGEFSAILTDELKRDILSSSAGRQILSLAHSDSKGSSGQDSGQAQLLRDRTEETLTRLLGQAWSLWDHRPELRAVLLEDLYYLRNWTFGIKPSSVRTMIRPRYERNMLALEALLEDCHDNAIPVVMYVAPIRQDVPLPYDLDGYNRWKQELQELAQHYSVHYRDLDTLVPGDLWGTYHDNNLDFMHFQGEGHKLLAQALQGIAASVLKNTGNAL